MEYAIARFPYHRWIAILLPGAAIAASLLSGGVAQVLDSLAMDQALIIVLALLGLWPFLLFCTLRFNAAVFVSFCLFGFVQIEPAPVDGLLMLLLALGVLTGQLSLSQLRGASVLHLAIWLFIALNVASILASASIMDSTRYAAITIYLIGITYFVPLYITSQKAMQIVMSGYLLTALANMAFVFAGYFDIGPAGMFVDQTRASGYFKDPNVFGPFLIPLIVLLVDEIWHPALFRQRNSLKILMVLMLSAGVFLSFSRAAWAISLLRSHSMCC